VHPPGRARVQFFEEIREIWTVVGLCAGVLRASTKKGQLLLGKEKYIPRENPGYAYDSGKDDNVGMFMCNVWKMQYSKTGTEVLHEKRN